MPYTNNLFKDSSRNFHLKDALCKQFVKNWKDIELIFFIKRLK